MIQRGGEVVLQMLSNVKQVTIRPLIQKTIAPSRLIYTDEYNIVLQYTAVSLKPRLCERLRDAVPSKVNIDYP